MPLENLTGSDKFIDALVITNPTSADDRYEGDNHLRGIKNVLKNTMPNVSGAINASHTELNALEGYDAAKGTVEARIVNNEAHVDQQEPDIHWDDAPVGPGVYARSRGTWVLVAGTGDSLGIVTAGSANVVDLDFIQYQDSSTPPNVFSVTNDRISYNILGSVAGRQIKVRFNGDLQPNAIAIVGSNGQAHGWLSANSIAEAMQWTEPGFSNTVTVQFVEVDGGSTEVIPPTKTVNVIKQTILADPSAPAPVLEMDTGGTQNQVNLELEIYQEGAVLTPIENTRMSYNILGLTAGHLIKASINGVIQPNILAESGANGGAHAWLSAKGIMELAGNTIGSPDGDYDITVQMVDAGPTGTGTALIDPLKTVRVTKNTVLAPTFGGPIEQVTWGWRADSAISMFYFDDVDAHTHPGGTGGSAGSNNKIYTGAEECSIAIFNSTPNATVQIRNAFNPTGPAANLANTNGEGNMFGSIGAHTMYALNSLNFGFVTLEALVNGVRKSTIRLEVIEEFIGEVPL